MTINRLRFALGGIVVSTSLSFTSCAHNDPPVPTNSESPEPAPAATVIRRSFWGNVTSVADSNVSAVSSSGREFIRLTGLKKSEWQKFNPGQAVWVDPVQKTATVVNFPIRSKRKDQTGDSHFMETEVIVSNPPGEKTGRIEGVTSTRSTEALRGFKGGVLVSLLDDQKNVLYRTTFRKFQVSGAAVAFESGDRRDTWLEENIDKDVLANTRAVAIVQLDSDQHPLDDFAKQTEEVLQWAETAVKSYLVASAVPAPLAATPHFESQELPPPR